MRNDDLIRQRLIAVAEAMTDRLEPTTQSNRRRSYAPLGARSRRALTINLRRATLVGVTEPGRANVILSRFHLPEVAVTKPATDRFELSLTAVDALGDDQQIEQFFSQVAAAR